MQSLQKTTVYGAAPSPVCFGLFWTTKILVCDSLDCGFAPWNNKKHDLFTGVVLSSNATPSASYYRLILCLLYRELIEKERWNGGSRYRCVN
jgi:hypothetical protein